MLLYDPGTSNTFGPLLLPENRWEAMDLRIRSEALALWGTTDLNELLDIWAGKKEHADD